VLLENVQNLVTHDSGRTFDTICNTLDELGYAINASPLILSPDDFDFVHSQEAHNLDYDVL
jgi:DNA (cytosine-5)-methyltransferase 1